MTSTLLTAAFLGIALISGVIIMELNLPTTPNPVLTETRNIDKEKCFSEGGIRFEVGTSGGGQHNVCVFENRK